MFAPRHGVYHCELGRAVRPQGAPGHAYQATQQFKRCLTIAQSAVRSAACKVEMLLHGLELMVSGAGNQGLREGQHVKRFENFAEWTQHR